MKEYITQDILQECWFLLKYFESEEYVSNKLKENHSLKETTLKRVSKSICNYIKQAKELYNAYESTSYLTNPLLLYYAFNDLAKAYILFKNPTTNLEGSHGLELKGNDVNKRLIFDTKILINSDGTFAQFEKLINNKFSQNEKISISDLFSNIPELINVYKISYKKEPNVFFTRINNNDNYENYLVEFDKSPDMTIVNEVLKINGGRMDVYKKGNKYYGSLTRLLKDTNFEDIFVKDIMGNKYFSYGINYNNGRNMINNLIVYYLILYTYSMYVRYYPNEWQKFLNSKESGIICKSIEVAKYDFLIGIVKLFMCEDFVFASKLEDIPKRENISDLTDKILKEISHKQRVMGDHSLGGIL